MMVLGIDPGLSGAVALYMPGLNGTLLVKDIPTVKAAKRGNEVNWAELATWLNELPRFDHAYIERVGALPGQGVSSMFKFGFVAGGLRGLVAGLQIPVTYVTPQKWKKALGVPAEKDGARARASELLPEHTHNWPLKKHDGRAEAALIAYYGVNIYPKGEEPRMAAE